MSPPLPFGECRAGPQPGWKPSCCFWIWRVDSCQNSPPVSWNRLSQGGRGFPLVGTPLSGPPFFLKGDPPPLSASPVVLSDTRCCRDMSAKPVPRHPGLHPLLVPCHQRTDWLSDLSTGDGQPHPKVLHLCFINRRHFCRNELLAPHNNIWVEDYSGSLPKFAAS